VSNKLNCWEYYKCGRERSGVVTDKLGVCQAAVDSSFDGINSGKCAGRICWAVAGTLCGGKIRGTFAQKRKSCTKCDFFKLVQKEEKKKAEKIGFLKFVSENVENFNINDLELLHIKSGERFIKQGVIEEHAYIIEEGSCLAIVEEDGELHPVGYDGPGDIVGIIGLLTKEPRTAHVEADTDLYIRKLPGDYFNKMCKNNSELLEFLTEMASKILESNRPIAMRSIGKYRATNILGRGGYSIVYQGVHVELNMPVAIKMMRYNLALDSYFLNAFMKEAQIIAKFNHQNIIRVYDIEKRFKTIFIIMEFLEGESLKSMIERIKRIPFKLLLSFLWQVCRALGYSHKHEIIHRDINPANIFIMKDNFIKVIDFGLACTSEAEDFEQGTIFYAAPELLEGDPASPRTDIFSLGITAYEMATGQRPFLDDNNNIPDPAEIVLDLPEQLRQFILKACKRDPEERYQNTSEALKTLEHIIGCPDSNNAPLESCKTFSLILDYKGEHELALNSLMEDFL